MTRASKEIGRWDGAAGEGRVNLIDTRDVAEAARIALLDDRSVHTQRAYHLTGPGPVSMPDVAELLSRLLGRSVAYKHRTPAEHREVLIGTGLAEPVADLLLGLDLMFEHSVLAETTATFSELTGRKPRSAETGYGTTSQPLQQCRRARSRREIKSHFRHAWRANALKPKPCDGSDKLRCNGTFTCGAVLKRDALAAYGAKRSSAERPTCLTLADILRLHCSL